MARESDGPSRTGVHTACLRHCRIRRGANTPAEQVDWAGLPVNLDLAFSQNQRDKVYAQHLKFERGGGLGRRASEVCDCDMTDHPDLDEDRDKSVSGW